VVTAAVGPPANRIAILSWRSVGTPPLYPLNTIEKISAKGAAYELVGLPGDRHGVVEGREPALALHRRRHVAELLIRVAVV
jgi:hypothetical protein